MRNRVSRRRVALSVATSAVLGIAMATPALAAGHAGGNSSAHAAHAGQFASTTSTASCNDGTLSAQPAILWPPNHKMHTISVTYSESDGDGEAISITGITESMVDGNGAVNVEGHGVGQPSSKQGADYVGPSNLPATGTDGGNPATTSVQIRSERSGAVGNGSGRVYSLTVTCQDAQTQTTDSNDLAESTGTQTGTGTVHVCVPHDHSSASIKFCEANI